MYTQFLVSWTLSTEHLQPPMAESDFTDSSSTLISEEAAASVDGKAAWLPGEDALILEADDELIQSLLSRESGFCSRIHGASSSQIMLKSERSDAVQWILKTKGFLSFGMKTVYVAVSFLDKFLAHPAADLMKGKGWAIRLLSVACSSLAAKMEELEAPTLSEFLIEDCQFHAAAIQRMELLILSTLQWRMRLVTPFPYLSYFASKIQEHGSKQLMEKSTKLIIACIEAMSLVEYRPSAIAAAAILAVSDERLTQESLESKMSILECGVLDSDSVFSCYKFMIQEVEKVAMALDSKKPRRCFFRLVAQGH